MTWFFLAATFAFVAYVVVIRNGNLRFWRLAAKFPDDAFVFFTSRECFYVDSGGATTKGNPERPGKWDGPFWFDYPPLGGPLRIYGRAPDYLTAQQEFVRTFGISRTGKVD